MFKAPHAAQRPSKFFLVPWRCLFSAAVLACLTGGTALADEAPLHERIDRFMAAAAVGPTPPQASDADFLRRVSLDLAGIVPTASETREFLADQSTDKRAKLIDRLLESPQHVRRLTLLFDVLLLERRSDKHVKETEWEDYLYTSFAANKPYDQLVRELLSADGADDKSRPAAKFFLNRDCEPNALTRDIGRLFYGMDLQCAQCHDHPIVDDYYQADYYGLYAFVSRTFVFADAKTKVSLVAEKGEGDVSFKSVFTGDSDDRVVPRLPKEEPIAEPVVAKGEEYLVKPAKNVRPVPKFSRRAQLAVVASESDAFSRNIVNRLWALMMGRGIVHPVEMHHVDNPPSHPELLRLLAAEFEASKYDLRHMLRELALSKTYQRSCDLPRREDWKVGGAKELLTTLEKAKQDREAQHERERALLALAGEKLTSAKDKNKKNGAGLPALQAALAKAKDTADKAAVVVKAAEQDKVEKQTKAALVAAAAEAAKKAAEANKDDKVLSAAASQIAGRTKAADAGVKEAENVLAKSQQQAVATLADVAKAQAAVDKVAADLVSPEQMAELEAAERKARSAAHEARYEVADYDARIETAKLLVEYEQLAASDPDAAARVWEKLIERWTERQQLAALKPLTAEQFALSLMQAVGVVGSERTSAEAKYKTNPPAELKSAAEADKARVQAALVEKKVFSDLRSQLNTFVGLYGTLPGEDFQATLNQALFFGNGSVTQQWVAPGGSNLAGRLVQCSDAGDLASELYLSVLTREPTADECAAVTEYLQGRTDDRPAAVGEMIWALLSSSEFRFNH